MSPAHTLVMHESQTLEHLEGDIPYSRFQKRFCSVFDHFIEVFFHVFKDKV